MTHPEFKARRAEILVTLFHSYSPRNETLAISEAAKELDALMLEVIGADSPMDNQNGIGRKLGWDEAYNQLRASIRQIITGKEK